MMGRNLVQAAFFYNLNKDFTIFCGFHDFHCGTGKLSFLNKEFLQIAVVFQRFTYRIPSGQDIFVIGICILCRYLGY